MGLFSGKIRTYVASSVYNLAGDESRRPEFLKATILGSVLVSRDGSVGDDLTNAVLNGSGMAQRRMYRWVRDRAQALKLPSAVVDAAQQVDTAAVRAGLLGTLSLAPNQSLRVIHAVIDDADIDYWAEDWIRQNRPGLGAAQWTADFDPTANEIVISVAGEPDTRIAAHADLLWGLDRKLDRRLLYVLYTVLTQDQTSRAVTESPAVMFTYRMGSGNVAFDNLAVPISSLSEFYPVLPLRLNNASIRDTGYEAEYADVKTAFRKLSGSSIDTLLDQIEQHPSVGDMDHVFLVPGVSLNTSENTAMGYLYAFFQGLIQRQTYTMDDLRTFIASQPQRDMTMNEWDRWRFAHDEIRYENLYRPAYGQPAPVLPQQVTTPPTVNELRIQSSNPAEFDFRIRWIAIEELQKQGNGKTFDGDQSRGLMKIGEYWITPGPDYNYSLVSNQWSDRRDESFVNSYDQVTLNSIYLFHQHSRYAYSRLQVVGLEHRNYVYGPLAVVTDAKQALLDASGEPSGFLVPLHYPSLKAMGLLDQTQLATASSYLVVNSYVQVKQKWWQTGIFRVILVIASVAASLLFPPGGLAAASGLLGTNLAVGTALGITSAATAAVVGSVVNSLAAIILTTLIQNVSVKLLGDKLGAVIGTIASFMAMTLGRQFAATGNFNVNWADLFRIENLQRVTSAVSEAYSRWLAADTRDIIAQIEAMKTSYEAELERIEDLASDILGMTNGIIDPMILTDSEEYFAESSETFLSRTLLTGSDLAQLSLMMIDSFADITLDLPGAIR